MKKVILFVVLVLASLNACADETWLDMTFRAYHFNRNDVAHYNLNEDNPGIGLRFTNGDSHKLIGVYKNSIHKWSNYALVANTPVKVGRISIGAIGGIVTGYEDLFQPAAGAYIIAKLTDDVNLDIIAVPTMRAIGIAGFASFQLSVKF
jgi:hypothetical protein